MSGSVSQMRAQRSGPLLLLLLLLAAGIAGMHTLGHATHGPSHAPMSVMAADHAASGVSAGWEGGSGRHGPMTDPTVMCLAILGGVALLAVALLLRFQRSTASGVRPPQPAARESGRGPPRTPVGLLLADLSVLRN
ncbi:hypothetical protein HDA40_005629 [Hamadaea flava]|uniref:DUF6153 family protein n=1 Tax=Hamadaea flava TaxID=1742688 RepID=A0ABV8LQR6_9ACTN|nr:DUF6153 family protein [Hamadaea flava]MCP2327122.1 hypothetical protein [Hamadaea flava]